MPDTLIIKQSIQESIESDEYFGNADKEHFFWLTKNKFISASEKEVLQNIKINSNDAVLEIGCGEGANIYNLNSNARFFAGIDLFCEKLKFAKQFVKKAKFICADAKDLPFSDDYFDLVFCRDVFHHVQDKDKMIQEMLRVLKPKKAIVMLESNGKNFFWAIFGTFIRPEKGVKRNTYKNFKLFFERFRNDFCKLRITYLNYPMLFRLLIHYKFGIKQIGNNHFFIVFSKYFLKYASLLSIKNSLPYLFIVAIKK